MVLRKIQQTGGSSFTISLPLDWARAYGVKKNQPVDVETQVDGALVIRPPRLRGGKTDPVRLQAKPGTKDSLLLRRLIGAYVRGCTQLVVSSADREMPEAHSVVERFLRMSVGMEIVEERAGEIVIKDIADPAEVTMVQTLRRMTHLTRQMVRQSVESVGNGEAGIAGLDELENDVDRLYLFMERKHQLFLIHPSLASAEGVRLSDSHWMFLASRSMERVGDHAMRIASQAPILHKDRQTERICSILSAQGKAVAEIYVASMQTLLEWDIDGANALIESNIQKRPIFDSVLLKAADLAPRISISAAYVVSSMRRISEYSDNIAEIAIDRGEEPKKPQT